MVNMGNVWDRTTEFLNDNLATILPVASLAIFLPQTVTTLIKQAGPAVNPTLATSIAILLLIPTFWGQLAITALAIDPDGGRSGAQSIATRRLVQAIAATLLLFVLLALLAAPIPVALAAGGADLSGLMTGDVAATATLSHGAAAFVGLYGLVWAVAALFISVRLSALLFAVIVAEGGIVSALKRSFALGRGLTWQMIGVFLVFSLVFGVAYLAATSAFGLIFKLIAPDSGPFGIGAIVVAIVAGLLMTAYYLVVPTFWAKLYVAATAANTGSAIRA